MFASFRLSSVTSPIPSKLLFLPLNPFFILSLNFFFHKIQIYIPPASKLSTFINMAIERSLNFPVWKNSPLLLMACLSISTPRWSTHSLCSCTRIPWVLHSIVPSHMPVPRPGNPYSFSNVYLENPTHLLKPK